LLYEKLKPKQKDAVRFALEKKTVALFFEQGTGKTWITGALIEKLSNPGFTGLLVVPLSNIETTWVELLKQLEPTVCRSWREFKKTSGSKIMLIHYDSFHKIVKQACKIHWSLVVFDESQKIKSRSSRQSRSAKKVHVGDCKLLLSGTPFDDFLNDPQELWAQFRFLVPSLFGTTWRTFDRNYLYPTGYKLKKRKFRKPMLKIFLNKIEPYVMRVKKEEVFDLPLLSYQHVPVDLLGEQGRIYREFEQNMVVALENGTLTAGLRIVQINKLQQICGGFVIDDDGTPRAVGRAKIRKLKSLLKRIELPVVVFCRYTEEIEQLVHELSTSNLRLATIQGRNRKERSATVRRFQEGKIDVLIAQVRTGGIGVDLFRASNAVVYSTTFSFIDFDQAVCRLHRGGQTKPVKIFLLYAKNTIDKDVFDAILLKHKVSELVLRRFKRKETYHGKDKGESSGEGDPEIRDQ